MNTPEQLDSQKRFWRKAERNVCKREKIGDFSKK